MKHVGRVELVLFDKVIWALFAIYSFEPGWHPNYYKLKKKKQTSKIKKIPEGQG